MSSTESNSNSASPNPPASGKPRSTAAVAVLGVVLLAALVWAMAPSRARFAPAPLREPPAGCPHVITDFVPTDITEVPGADVSALSKPQQNHVLYRLNFEPCPCGCNTSIAACRMNHPACPLCKDLVQKIIAEERSAQRQEPDPQIRK